MNWKLRVLKSKTEYRVRRWIADRALAWLKRNNYMPLPDIQFIPQAVYPSSPDDRYVPLMLEVRHVFDPMELTRIIEEGREGYYTKRVHLDMQQQLFDKVMELMSKDIAWYDETSGPYGFEESAPMIGARLLVMVKQR